MILRLNQWLRVPGTRDIDLDAPKAIGIHRDILRNKPFLRRLYKDFYHFFVSEAKTVQPLSGKMLEVGSGGGFLKTLIPDVVTSDVCADSEIDQVVDAERLPYAAGELKAIFMLNVLHHLPRPRIFFREADRCLKPKGRLVMIEPFNSTFGCWIYKHFHHEPFEETVPDWEQVSDGRMSTSNQAIPWIIFWRDRKRFEQEFPNLRIAQIVPHTPLRYLVSGGLSNRALSPDVAFPAFTAIDHILSHWVRIFPIFQTIVIEKH